GQVGPCGPGGSQLRDAGTQPGEQYGSSHGQEQPLYRNGRTMWTAGGPWQGYLDVGIATNGVKEQIAVRVDLQAGLVHTATRGEQFTATEALYAARIPDLERMQPDLSGSGGGIDTNPVYTRRDRQLDRVVAGLAVVLDGESPAVALRKDFIMGAIEERAPLAPRRAHLQLRDDRRAGQAEDVHAHEKEKCDEARSRQPGTNPR